MNKTEQDQTSNTVKAPLQDNNIVEVLLKNGKTVHVALQDGETCIVLETGEIITVWVQAGEIIATLQSGEIIIKQLQPGGTNVGQLQPGETITSLRVGPYGSTVKEIFTVHRVQNSWHIKSTRKDPLGNYAMYEFGVLKEALIFRGTDFPYRVDSELNTFIDNWYINIVDDDKPENIRLFLEQNNINPYFSDWQNICLCITATEEPFPVYKWLYHEGPDCFAKPGTTRKEVAAVLSRETRGYYNHPKPKTAPLFINH